MSRLLLFLLAAAVLAALVVLLLRRRRGRARAALRGRPFPEAWRDVLERSFPLYRRLPAEDRERLHGRIQVFLAEKSFEGCGGLELTDEIRVTIAGQACLLLLNLEEADYYAHLRSILVYPSTVRPVYVERPTTGTIPPAEEALLGQSWGHGTVILAWDSVRRSASATEDGRNVVFHEFAHQLDQEDGAADGVPYLESASALRAWGEIMQAHYAALREAVEEGRRTLLDEYGATNPAEFFAVATEFFFEKPVQLKRRHPALYDELAGYYRQDPASWAEPPSGQPAADPPGR
ncbi:MAG TPA: M90 family metallopeptidase [Longimicrobiaceae bacterium]|nr:M90 family metallopeptidase [Longimicrobiaceae bacterium]